jgi:hypothetical protein
MNIESYTHGDTLATPGVKFDPKLFMYLQPSKSKRQIEQLKVLIHTLRSNHRKEETKSRKCNKKDIAICKVVNEREKLTTHITLTAVLSTL